jgi:hypothetical protein
MNDIYPQSEPDSHALIAEQHPLSIRVRELEQEILKMRMSETALLDGFRQQTKSIMEKNAELQRRTGEILVEARKLIQQTEYFKAWMPEVFE